MSLEWHQIESQAVCRKEILSKRLLRQTEGLFSFSLIEIGCQGWMRLRVAIFPLLPPCGCQGNLYIPGRKCGAIWLRPRKTQGAYRNCTWIHLFLIWTTSPIQITYKKSNANFIRNFYFLLLQSSCRSSVSTSSLCLLLSLFFQLTLLLSISTSSF
jgi:hypothetical protein